MSDTKTPAEMFRDIPLHFTFQDFLRLSRVPNENPSPNSKDTFHSIDITLGIYDTENLVQDIGRAVGMEPEELRAIVAQFRPYTAKFAGPETPPEF